MSDTTIVFFGCWGRPGHFLWSPRHQMLSDHEVWSLGMPTAAQLDGGRLFLPHPEKIGSGAITYLPAPHLTVLAWWGNNPWDNRGKVNSAVITNGELRDEILWHKFGQYFPELEKELKHPRLDKP